MYAPGFEPPGQAAAPDSSRCELRRRYDAVLSGRDGGDHSIGCGAFLPHMVMKAPRSPDSPPLRLPPRS
jgi:hypothetical protein